MTQYDILNVTQNATLDEIKAQYRKLVKQYHPDLNKHADAAIRFNELVLAYEWLLENHKPPVAVQVLSDISDVLQSDKFYRTFEERSKVCVIWLPVANIERKTVVFCMIGDIEVRVVLNPGIDLPYQIKLLNLRREYVLEIREEKPF